MDEVDGGEGERCKIGDAGEILAPPDFPNVAVGLSLAGTIMNTFTTT
jgi:hypothetical protein